MSEWISIDDRLQEYDKPILFHLLLQSCSGGVFSEDHVTVSGKLTLDDDGPAWVAGNQMIIWDYDFNLGFSMDDVTHWMPLPEPPK